MDLTVYREFEGTYQIVGRLSNEAGKTIFSYADSYMNLSTAQPISVTLPLSDGPFSPEATAAFFDGIVPEGSLRRDIAEVARVDRRDYLAILNQVRNEPIGALLFSDNEDISQLEMSYEELPSGKVSELAAVPARASLDMTLESRISLAGAQSKVGLYHDGTDASKGWFLPKGGAPSTHIVKACSDAFPDATLCEALCMRAAYHMELASEQCFLVKTGASPLLAVQRYDRVCDENDTRRVNGLKVPRRLHQEDMCQALGIGSLFKYEPTSANYLNMMASILTSFVSDPLGDRFMLAYYQLFDFVVGNCDNHLKNWSILYDVNWCGAALAPLYDVVGTTIYPQLSREMGVSFGGNRVIDGVSAALVRDRLASIGVSRVMAKGIASDVCAELLSALRRAAEELSSEGFPQVNSVLEEMLPGVKQRLAVLEDACE